MSIGSGKTHVYYTSISASATLSRCMRSNSCCTRAARLYRVGDMPSRAHVGRLGGLRRYSRRDKVGTVCKLSTNDVLSFICIHSIVGL